MTSSNRDRKVLSPGDLLRSFRWFGPDVRRLLLVGCLDAIGRQPLWFVLPLMLEAMGYGLDVIGIVIFVLGLSTTVPMIPIGYVGDRFGRKNMMVVGLLISTFGLGIFVFADTLPLIYVAVAVGGLGTAMTGSCYTALLSEKVVNRQRKYLLSLQGLVGMGASAGWVFAIGFLAPWYGMTIGGGLVEGDQFIFSIGMVAMALEMVVLATVHERKKEKFNIKGRSWPLPWSGVTDGTYRDGDGKGDREAKRSFDKNIPWRTIAKLSAPMALLGLGAGFIVNFFQNFFSMRFHTPMWQIGILFGLTNLIWAASYMFMPLLAERIGSIRAIFLTEVTAILALIAIPLSGDFYITAIMYTTRMVLMNSSWPIWSAYAINTAGERYGATTMSTTQTCFNGLRSITPAIAGYIYIMSWDLPFFICAAFYTAAASLTFWFFWDQDDGPYARERKEMDRKRRKEERDHQAMGKKGSDEPKPTCIEDGRGRQPGL